MVLFEWRWTVWCCLSPVGLIAADSCQDVLGKVMVCVMTGPFHACRGIDVVRNKIKMFAQTKVTLPPGRHKMVILDEADR